MLKSSTKMRIYLVFVLNICFVFNVFSKTRNLVFFWDSLNCTANEKYVSEISCSVQEDNSAAFADVVLTKDISNVKLTISIFLPQAGKEGFHHFLDMNIELCNFLSGNIKTSLLSIVQESITKYSNFPKKCPLLKDTKYHVRNLTLDASKLPSFRPITKFQVHLKLFIPSKATLLSVGIEGRLADANNQNKN